MSAVDVFLIIQRVAVGILCFLLIYAVTQKSSTLNKHLIVVIISTILFLVGYNLELRATTLEAAYMAACISYMGEPFVLLGEFMLVCAFFDKKVPGKVFVFLACIAFSFTVLVSSNDLHHLYYTSISFDESRDFSSLVVEHGPLYWLNVASSIAYFIACTVVIISGVRQSQSKMKRRLSIYTILMIACDMVSFAIYALGITGGYDATMIGLSLSAIFLAILFFRCKIFDVVDRSKDYALDNSSNGLLIFDDSDKIAYSNPAAQAITSEAISLETIKEQKDTSAVYPTEAAVYSINVSTLYNKENYIGKSVEIHDVTDSYNNQARLEAAVAYATSKLEAINRRVFASLASIVEARSLETGDHIHRVSAYTEMIAKELKNDPRFAEVLTDDYVNTLVVSAPLHDIGKISVSDTILLKPGRLTPEEFDEMKKHSAAGAEILKTTMANLEDENYINMAVDIARHHHERFDGAGYPDGLAGEEIPLSARIVAVADCYDAMTSKRCYKDAFPDDKALGILKEESGTHFDPAIVEAFFRCKK